MRADSAFSLPIEQLSDGFCVGGPLGYGQVLIRERCICEGIRCRVSSRTILPTATSQMMLNIHPHQCVRWGSGGHKRQSTPTTAGTSEQLLWHGEVPGAEWQLGGAEVQEAGQPVGSLSKVWLDSSKGNCGAASLSPLGTCVV